MPTVSFDTNASTTAQSDKGFTVSRVATVSGLTGAVAARLQEAISFLGTPIGSAHPGIPGMTLRNINAGFMDDSHSVAILTMQYTPPEQGALPGVGPAPSDGQVQISVGATVTQETANTDVNGNVVEVQFTPPLEEDQEEQDPEEEQGGTFSILIPNVTITARRTETESPGAKAIRFVGTVNSGTWSLDPGAKRRTWLCTGIEGDSQDSGRTYDVTYSFQFQRQDIPGRGGAQRFGWDTNVVFIDSETGRPPPGIPAPSPAGGKGSSSNRDVQVYREMNFGDLRL